MANPIGKIKVTKRGGTEIMHSGSQVLMFRMDAPLNAFDLEMLRQIAAAAYSAGIEDGKRELQNDFKSMLGID